MKFRVLKNCRKSSFEQLLGWSFLMWKISVWFSNILLNGSQKISQKLHKTIIPTITPKHLILLSYLFFSVFKNHSISLTMLGKSGNHHAFWQFLHFYFYSDPVLSPTCLFPNHLCLSPQKLPHLSTHTLSSLSTCCPSQVEIVCVRSETQTHNRVSRL